jgi:hypothetical protein
MDALLEFVAADIGTGQKDGATARVSSPDFDVRAGARDRDCNRTAAGPDIDNTCSAFSESLTCCGHELLACRARCHHAAGGDQQRQAAEDDFAHARSA